MVSYSYHRNRIKKNFMNSGEAIHISKCLGRLTDKYELGAVCLQRIKDLKKFLITSISFTADGGFDESTGTFHCEERPITFKVRIKYKKDGNSSEEFIVLKPVKNKIPEGKKRRQVVEISNNGPLKIDNNGNLSRR